MIGAIKSILIAAANESVIHQIAVIYLSSLSFHFLWQSCRRYQSTCARTGRRSIQNGSSMGRRFRRAYWTASIQHFASINYSEWRAGKETALRCYFFGKTLIKELKEIETFRSLRFSFSRLKRLLSAACA